MNNALSVFILLGALGVLGYAWLQLDELRNKFTEEDETVSWGFIVLLYFIIVLVVVIFV